MENTEKTSKRHMKHCMTEDPQREERENVVEVVSDQILI